MKRCKLCGFKWFGSDFSSHVCAGPAVPSPVVARTAYDMVLELDERLKEAERRIEDLVGTVKSQSKIIYGFRRKLDKQEVLIGRMKGRWLRESEANPGTGYIWESAEGGDDGHAV